MRTIIASMLLIAGISSVNAQVNELLRKNIMRSTKMYRQAVAVQEVTAPLLRLWIHCRADSQLAVAEKIYAALGDTAKTGLLIEKKPVQVVANGPSKNQLRFFKREDAADASKLFNELKQLLPHLTLADLSVRYENVRSIRVGHFELWLTSNVTLAVQP